MNNNINIDSTIVEPVNVYYTCILHYLVILSVFMVTFNNYKLHIVTTKLIMGRQDHGYNEQIVEIPIVLG